MWGWATANNYPKGRIMKHSGIWAIRQGRSSIFVAPSKFEKEERKQGLSNRDINQLIAGRRVLEAKPMEARHAYS